MRPSFKPSRFIQLVTDTLALVDDTAVTEFGSSITVYVGHPGGAVGDQDDTPFVVIIPNGDSLGEFQDTYSWSWSIAFCADATTMDRTIANEVTMEVVDKLTNLIDDFTREFNTALEDSNVTLATLDSRWVFEDHPLTSCILEANFTMPNTLGISTVTF